MRILSLGLKNLTAMTETITSIYKRRSVRKYKPATIATTYIEEIIAAGKMAPSAINAQPWKFYVMNDQTLITKMSEEIAAAAEQHAYLSHGVHLSQPADRIFFGSPLVIFISAPKTNEWSRLDVGMCAQNMMLAATSLGLDSCPIGFGKFVERTKSYSIMNVPSSEEIIIAIVFGYGDHAPQMESRLMNNVFYVK